MAATGLTRQSADLSWLGEAGAARSSGSKDATYEQVEIPEDFGPMRVTVDEHKVKAFAFSQDDYSAWAPNGGGLAGAVAPAGILANDLLTIFTTKYDRNTVVGLHTEEQLWFDSPISVGEEVTLTGRYVEKYERRGKGYVVLEAQAVGSDGRSLVRHRGVEIMRIAPGPVVGRRTSGASAGQITGERTTDLAPVAHAHADLPVGTPLPTLVKTIHPDQASVFSYAGEYPRTIHTDLDRALEGGLERPLVQGQQQNCFVTEALAGFFGADWLVSGWQKLKFLAPILVGDTIAVDGAVSGTEETPDGLRLAVEVWVRNRSREDALTAVAWASAVIPRP